MTAYGWWIIGFAVAYTAVLIFAGYRARSRATTGNDYFVGGRRFSSWQVAFCITALFSGSSFVAILELSYLTGISAIWYGLAETVQVILITLILLRPFRERLLVTISGLIGDQFGRTARGVAGAITAFAFPMWSVATALAFASGIHVFTGLPLTWSVAFTSLLLLVYLQAGGMWSIAFTQTVNNAAFAAMFIVGLIAFFIEPGWSGLTAFLRERPEFLHPTGAGLQVIVAWFGTFIVNVILAQAAFQMALSCRTPEEGRKGMVWALIFDVPFMVLGVLFGTAAAVVVPGLQQGLIAVPVYIAQVLPAPLVGIFFLGIWACALGWAAPCQFSGATSLGRDVGLALRPNAKESDLVRYTRWSLTLLTILMVVFGAIRSEQSAWWNILAWTTRNGATFAPVLAALVWPLVSRRAAVISMIVGCAAGLFWYNLSGWAVNSFYWDIHPVWVGMGSNLLTLLVLSLLDLAPGRWSWAESGSGLRRWGVAALAAGVFIVVAAAIYVQPLRASGLLGLVLFSGLVLLAAAQFTLVRPTAAAAAGPDQVSVLSSPTPAVTHHNLPS